MTQPAPFQLPAFPTTDEVFGEGGLLAACFPGYAPRAGQIQMTTEVDAAFAEKRRLVIEGPTGTGKSIAYLVPAIRAYVSEATKVLVVTSNIALQEQLVTKDLPALLRALRRPFRFALLKGIGNYLCREAVDDALLDPKSPIEVRDVAAWGARTLTGDFSELDAELEPRLRMLTTTTSEECLGTKCPSRERCFVVRARLNSRASHVIVVNYHLFFADLAIRAEGGDGILPDHGAVILDELHNAADIARSFFGRKLTMGSVLSASRRLLSLKASLAKDLERAADAFFVELERHRRSDLYRARLLVRDPVEWEGLEHLLRAASKAFTDEATGHEDQAQVQKLQAAAAGADRMAALVRAAMTLADEAGTAYSIDEPEGNRSCALVSQPIDVSTMLRHHFWDSTRLGTVVGTSATLGDGKSLDLVAREVGADAARQVIVPSPFDWPRQAVIAVPPGLPLPSSRDWPDAVCAALEEAVRAASGRTLALFTSRKMLKVARDYLFRAGLPWQVLCQGDAPRTKLVERFRQDVSSVLLGTASLWEGVDVQGEALSCVVVDKLPFDSPDDPVASVLEQRMKDYWKRVALPKAVQRFRQGGGRLIRTSTDRGALVVLDDRVVSKPYGRKFIRGFPEGVRVITHSGWASEVKSFIETGAPF